MPEDDVPLGRPYSHLYVPKDDPAPDDERARFRLAGLIDAVGEGGLGNYAEQELGVRVPWHGAMGRHWPDFLESLDRVDLLNFITVAFRYFVKRDVEYERQMRTAGRTATRWRDGVRRIFSEQNLAYEVDDQGGVHPLIDQAYQTEVQATVAALGRQRYANAAQELRNGLTALDSPVPDGKGASEESFWLRKWCSSCCTPRRRD